MLDRKGLEPLLLDLRGITLIADFFLLCHGTSGVHVRALADSVLERLAAKGMKPQGVEGHGQGQWVLLDFGDVMVHVFSREGREFYGLERLWGDAPQKRIVAPARRRRISEKER